MCSLPFSQHDRHLIAWGALSGVVEGDDAVFEVTVPRLGFELDAGLEGDADLVPFAEGAAGLGLVAPLDEVRTRTPADCAGGGLAFEGDIAGASRCGVVS